jgi:hypothetical protein
MTVTGLLMANSCGIGTMARMIPSAIGRGNDL